MSEPWDGNIEFTLNEVGAIEPILELNIGLPINRDVHKAGMHHLRLADYDIHLKPAQEYEWFVAIVPDPEQRSGDLLASGTIRYVEPTAKLTRRLSQTPPEQWYKVYADEGIWYEAIVNLCEQIEKQPKNKELLMVRANLSRQVAMPKVAHYDEAAFK
jgi:hypothetical protein